MAIGAASGKRCKTHGVTARKFRVPDALARSTPDQDAARKRHYSDGQEKPYH